MDDGEAPDWNDPEMGKTGQWSRRWRGVGNLTGSDAGWAYTWQRITGGVGEWRDGLASGGSSRGGEASVVAQLATGGRRRRHDRRCFGRLEQEDQRLKKHYGR